MGEGVASVHDLGCEHRQNIAFKMAVQMLSLLGLQLAAAQPADLILPEQPFQLLQHPVPPLVERCRGGKHSLQLLSGCHA
ncbi:hypothetical protein SDC9_74215 [bioreactor metagenome]|uniref:Uncharacterized protein n=1 Tax=bioreactor metagenome TaxID=1076179 RepID=A0A644YGH2_9ZZZZ